MVYKASCVDSHWISGMLCLYRGAAFVFFSLGAGVFNWVYLEPYTTNYQYFTHWNIVLAILYYFLATVASTIGLSIGPTAKPIEWSPKVVMFGHVVRVVFEVAGSTAMFVTVFDFLFLSSSIDYLNISEHLVTALSFLLEMFLNAMVVRLDHMPFMLSWAAAYLIFVSGMVASNTLAEWPYFFLSADTQSSYIWYTILVVGLVVFYGIWWTLSSLKTKLCPSILTQLVFAPHECVNVLDIEVGQLRDSAISK